MNIFGEPYNRGCFVKKSVDTSGGRGVRLQGSQTIPASDTDPFVVAGFSIRKEETIAIMRCFNDTSFIYAFGDNIEQSVLSVKIIGFMPADSQGSSVTTMLNFYSTNRISKRPRVTYLYYGGNNAITGYVLGMESSTVSDDFGLQSYDIKLLLTGM